MTLPVGGGGEASWREERGVRAIQGENGRNLVRAGLSRRASGKDGGVL